MMDNHFLLRCLSLLFSSYREFAWINSDRRASRAGNSWPERTEPTSGLWTRHFLIFTLSIIITLSFLRKYKYLAKIVHIVRGGLSTGPWDLNIVYTENCQQKNLPIIPRCWDIEQKCSECRVPLGSWQSLVVGSLWPGAITRAKPPVIQQDSHGIYNQQTLGKVALNLGGYFSYIFLILGWTDKIVDPGMWTREDSILNSRLQI